MATAKATTKTTDSVQAAAARKLSAARKRQRSAKKKRKLTDAEKAKIRKQTKYLVAEAAKRTAEKKPRPKTRRYSLPPPPPGMRPDRPGAVKAPANVQGAACLTHGIPVDYVFDALSRQKLSSAFTRLGPNGEYRRTNDKRGGGGTAVYTRAVGTTHNPPAHGMGVGSSAKSTVQFIMSPAILERPDHVWRANGTDGGGDLPGVLFSQRKGGSVDPQHVKRLWEMQSESDRNSQFNRTVNAPPNELLNNNEQLHYHALPLENVLKAVVATSDDTFEKLMAMEGSQREDPTHGFVRMGDQMIRVILAEPNAGLLDVLKAEKIADENTGQVR